MMGRSRRKARQGARAGQRRRLLVVLVASLALVAVTVVLLVRRDDGPTRLTAMDGPDPGVVHVHGLGVDPADGTLYAATHLGLFRIPAEGKAARIANRYQDTMGFTVVGPNHFLGSGHPDANEDTGRNVPPLLGLIESTDAGETWDRVSLLGEADFHALHYAHGQVYGYDSTNGRFMVSTDRRKWDTRSTGELLDFAVSPTDPDTVLAVADGALRRSTDGGRTWTPVSAPAVALLHWPDAGHLWALSPTGQVLLSTDNAATFDVQGRLAGPPEAITSDGTTLYAAVQRAGIYTSTDNGRTWTLRYADPKH